MAAKRPANIAMTSNATTTVATVLCDFFDLNII